MLPDGDAQQERLLGYLLAVASRMGIRDEALEQALAKALNERTKDF